MNKALLRKDLLRYKETTAFDIAISKAQKEIAAIKEYREALITDLVTGKRSISPTQRS